MYLEHFGLSDYPFDGLPDRRFYYVGGSQHQSLGLLTTALSRSGTICVLSGPSGAGKTTLVRMLMRSLPRRMRIISIDDPRLDPHMLLATVLRASGVVATSFESIAELTLKLRQMLEKSIAMGIITTVICDEAQGLSDEVLEQIRLISNIEGEAGKMINFLLVGQEDLLTHINKPEHDMLKNRIKIFAVLPRLKEEEVGAYLTYRMQQVGCMKPVFTNRAIAMITRKSNGVPRLINAIADMSLTLACEKKKQQVTSLIAKRAAHLVRYNQEGFKNTLQLVLRELLSVSLYERILVVGAAALCAGAAFIGSLKLMENYYPVRTIEDALITDREVQNRYNSVTRYLFQGRNAEGRELYFFNQAVSEAYFKSEAFATLFKVHGYAVASAEEDATISDELLKEVDLQSMHQQGTFAEAISYNSPVLIGLLDDNLTPFYAVLYQLNEDIAQLIIGNYMFSVKLSYLEERYMGAYTLLHPYIGDLEDLKSRQTDTRKAMENKLRPYLEQYCQRALESANREANIALGNYDRQKEVVQQARMNVRQELMNHLDSSKSDAELENELTARLDSALEQDEAYQSAVRLLYELEDISSEKEQRAVGIRAISLKLNDGYQRAMNLFLGDQHLTGVTHRAVALLTLNFYDGPRLLNVVGTGTVPAADADKTAPDAAAVSDKAAPAAADKTAPAAADKTASVASDKAAPAAAK